MANIEKRELEELSDDAQIIVGLVDYAIEGASLPTTISLDADIEDVADALKYIIDTGWLGNECIYARKMKLTSSYDEVKHIGVSTDKDYFTYMTDLKYCNINENEPMIIGKTEHFNNTDNPLNGYYDGNVFIRLADGTMLSKQEWIERNPKQKIKD